MASYYFVKADTEATQAGEAGFFRPQNFPYKSVSKNSYFRSEATFFLVGCLIAAALQKGQVLKLQ